VHVWRADLATVGGGLGDLLNAAERGRAERFARERDGELWVRSRAVLRALLGRYLGVDPRAPRFAVSEHGKPRLASGGGIFFNLSHSAGLALYAFSEGREVGVDVEARRRSLDELALAARIFASADTKRLAEMGEPDREQEFLRMWTRHEAELKLLGTGFGAASSGTEGGSWIAELDMGLRAAGAVASAQPPRELRRWELL
jgi:4'-phosphopantetheinyl transferase